MIQNPQTVKLIVIILFALMYVLLLALPKIRAYIALACATIFVLIGALPFKQVFSEINWNVLMMIAGTMGTVYFFIESKMPSLLADIIIKRMPNVKWAIISLSLFAGIISAFVDNVATVLMVAPIALTISKKLNISPVLSIISIAVASNLQGAATLVGDTTSILLGGYANMSFLDFFFMNGKIGMFWIVQCGAIASTFVLMYIFRKDTQPIKIEDTTKVTDYFPTIMLVGTVVLLIIASFFPAEAKPEITNGLICIILFVICLVREFIKSKDFAIIKKAMAEVDFFTLLLLGSLFVVIGGVSNVGIVNDIGNFFLKITDNIFILYTLIVWFSVLLSAFIDNIPYIATMLPIVTAMSASLGGASVYVLYFGLLVGATLGGNLTPVGASANITAIGILRKAGFEVNSKTFMKVSVPFTLSAVLAGYILVWLIWK